MTEPLVDPEGYPRNDIDVYQVRLARHRIICKFRNFFYRPCTFFILKLWNFSSMSCKSDVIYCKGLQTDYKELTKQIEKEIHLHHKQMREAGLAIVPMDVDATQESHEHKVPIAKVNIVSEGSPAYHAVSKYCFRKNHVKN